MRITALVPKSACLTVILVAMVALGLGAALVDPAAAQLVNPGFDSGPTGPVGNFGTVVGPPFSAGFWGAEDADILAGNPCVSPKSNPYFLQLNVGGGSYSQAWQAVDVSASPPVNATLSAWFNTCGAGAGTVVGVAIRTFNDVNGWPTHTLYTTAQITLTADLKWHQVKLDCVQVPADTKWIVAELFMANATANNVPSAVDDVNLSFEPCAVPTQPTTWGAVKSLYKK